jgi:hypothetical protein
VTGKAARAGAQALRYRPTVATAYALLYRAPTLFQRGIETECWMAGNATIKDQPARKPGNHAVADHDRSRMAAAWLVIANSISLSTPAGIKNSRLRSSLLVAGAAWFVNYPASRRPPGQTREQFSGERHSRKNHFNRIGTTSTRKILNRGSRRRLAFPRSKLSRSEKDR